MPLNLTRRTTLLGLSGSLMAPFLAHGGTRLQLNSTRFLHGVASGDPDHNSLVIWTRVSGYSAPTNVAWEVATDDAFKNPIASGSSRTSQERDYTVKVVVGGLTAGKRYYYRFSAGGEYSDTGRSRSLPQGSLDSLTLAVASCSNYPFGFFNAYDAIARDESIDWVLHLGDYIYEYGVDGYGGDTGTQLNRAHAPTHEIVSLEDYRQRHAQYKADPQSRAMHAAHPLLAIWDDHETTNNPWMGGAQNHQEETEGDWAARRTAALRAYFEWMPVRDPLPGHDRADYWRHWRFGDLASLISLETRHSGRAEQIEYTDYPGALNSPRSAKQFLADVVGAEDRPMLSPSMESFFSGALCDAVVTERPWRIVANQIPMARTFHPQLTADDVATLKPQLTAASVDRLERMARMGELGLPLYLDPWDGYPVAREDFYALCDACGATDLLVLTGDSHSFWSNSLYDKRRRPMGVELGTTGITSPGDFLEFGDEGARVLDERLADSNREVEWTDGRHNGFVRVALTREGGRADYVAVSTILEPRYRSSVLRSVALERRDGTLVYRS